MASIYQRTNKDGSKVWRAAIRIKGHPPVCNHDERKQVVEDWAKETEAKIKNGKYDFAKNKEKTLSELIDLYIQDAVISHHKAADDTIYQLSYFRDKIGKYALNYITPELLLAERKKLPTEKSKRGKILNPATVNRYFSTLSGAFRYACKNMRWINENPCLNLLKLKAKPKVRRILHQDEEIRLLAACRESKSPYLYCIVLMALTTAARKSEILNLNWDDIHFDIRIAHIKDSKNGRSRNIGLVGSVINELKKIYDKRDPRKNLVFASKTAFGKIDIKKSWNKALQIAEIEGFVFHGLRHHYCSVGAKDGASGLQLRSQMGHTTASMTDHYTHLDAESTRFIGENIEKRLLKGVAHANK